MRDASPDLIAFLGENTAFQMADLFTLTLNNGTELRYTSADTPIVAGGRHFALGPVIQRDKVRLVAGLEVDELSLTIQCDASLAVPGVAGGLVAFGARGGLDGAELLLERAFMPSWGNTSLGTLLLFKGRISSVECTRWEIKATVRSALELLNTQIPRMTYQAGCRNTLFDGNLSGFTEKDIPIGTGCFVRRDEFEAAGHVTGTLNQWLFHNLEQPDGYFDLGVITMTSGANEGVARTVKRYTLTDPSTASHMIAPMAPFPEKVAAGDTFVIVPGCDKTLATCQTKFNVPIRDLTVSHLGTDWRKIAWQRRFSGEPFIPAPETVV